MPRCLTPSCVPMGASDSWCRPFTQPCPTAPIGKLFPHWDSSAWILQPHQCPGSRASQAFSRLGNGVYLSGSGLTSTGLDTHNFPASVHGKGGFLHSLRIQVHWRLNTLEYSWEGGWRLLGKERQRCLPGSFGTFVDKWLLHDVQLLIPST